MSPPITYRLAPPVRPHPRQGEPPPAARRSCPSPLALPRTASPPAPGPPTVVLLSRQTKRCSINGLTSAFQRAIIISVSRHCREYLPSVRSAPPRHRALVPCPHLENRPFGAPFRRPRAAKSAFVDTRHDSVDSLRFLGPFAGPPSRIPALSPAAPSQPSRIAAAPQPQAFAASPQGRLRSPRSSSASSRPSSVSGSGLSGGAKCAFCESTFLTRFSAPNRQKRVYRPRPAGTATAGGPQVGGRETSSGSG